MRNQETTELVILGILMNDSMHGYEIKKFLLGNLKNIWHIGTSQIYLILQRLEKNKMVFGTVTYQENRQSKKIFTITDDGKGKFIEWVQSPTKHVRNIRTDFMTKLFFIKHLQLHGGMKLIEAQIDSLINIRGKVKQEYKNKTNEYGKVVLGFKISQLNACISWLKEDAVNYITKCCSQ